MTFQSLSKPYRRSVLVTNDIYPKTGLSKFCCGVNATQILRNSIYIYIYTYTLHINSNPQKDGLRKWIRALFLAFGEYYMYTANPTFDRAGSQLKFRGGGRFDPSWREVEQHICSHGAEDLIPSWREVEQHICSEGVGDCYILRSYFGYIIALCPDRFRECVMHHYIQLFQKAFYSNWAMVHRVPGPAGLRGMGSRIWSPRGARRARRAREARRARGARRAREGRKLRVYHPKNKSQLSFWVAVVLTFAYLEHPNIKIGLTPQKKAPRYSRNKLGSK